MENEDDNNPLTNIDNEMDRNYQVNVIIESLDSSDEETEVEHPQRAQSGRSSITLIHLPLAELEVRSAVQFLLA